MTRPCNFLIHVMLHLDLTNINASLQEQVCFNLVVKTIKLKEYIYVFKAVFEKRKIILYRVTHVEIRFIPFITLNIQLEYHHILKTNMKIISSD